MTERRGGDHWRRLTRALGLEAQQVGGFGEVTVAITFSDGVPHQVRVVERRPTYRLDRESTPIATKTGDTQGAPDVV